MDLTPFFAKLLGAWILITVAGMAVNRDATLTTMNVFFSDPAVMFVTGVFTLLAGLVVVILHNRWSGGAATVLVTVYGWIALIKGAAFLWFPPSWQTAFYRTLHLDQFFYAYVAVSAVLGLYLLLAGFRSPVGRSRL